MSEEMKQTFYELWLDNGVFFGEYPTLQHVKDVLRTEIEPDEKVKVYKFTQEYLGGWESVYG